MKKEMRTVFYDEDLQIEAYRFAGVAQPFPVHFHDYYVVGFIESGSRRLTCESAEYSVGAGDVLLFNPRDKHACTQVNGGTFDYRAFNIKPEVMDNLAKEITGRQCALQFNKNIIQDAELFLSLRKLHESVLQKSDDFEKSERLKLSLKCRDNFNFEFLSETRLFTPIFRSAAKSHFCQLPNLKIRELAKNKELLFFAFGQLMQEYGEPFEHSVAEHGGEIEKACAYMRQNFAERISLDTLCEVSALSKATLIRSFAKTKGISPYRYLENIRLGEAKKLLEQGAAPAEAAFSTGFSDQPHFTNFFKDYIGLTPKQYRNIFISKARGKS